MLRAVTGGGWINRRLIRHGDFAVVRGLAFDLRVDWRILATLLRDGLPWSGAIHPPPMVLIEQIAGTKKEA
ncbi:hypothetical protein [Pseudomonas sp. MS19]|uniref:hypothetical protein n=1 Tax=Pseudomonas sp. MS19 TaxID=2579939 RepID=UPI001562B066|nr:hypothetical protein [Pseudomonas sp. MS19]NRH27211.1 hypothetical protein [Pseudomonas sp. MS19]